MSLVRIGSPPPPPTDNPVELLLACHRKIEERLAAIERAAAALIERPGEALGVIADAVRWLETAGARHTDDEEASFFPRIFEDAALLDALTAEHRTGEAILLALRTVVRRAQDDGVVSPAVAEEMRTHAAALVASYREHIADEEVRFVPLARKLEEKELEAIAIEMRLRRGGPAGA